MVLDEDLRKKMGEAFEKGDFDRALKLSRQLDKQILKYTRYWCTKMHNKEKYS